MIVSWLILSSTISCVLKNFISCLYKTKWISINDSVNHFISNYIWTYTTWKTKFNESWKNEKSRCSLLALGGPDWWVNASTQGVIDLYIRYCKGWNSVDARMEIFLSGIKTFVFPIYFELYDLVRWTIDKINMTYLYICRNTKRNNGGTQIILIIT